MLFSSITFLCYFLPAAILLYFVVPASMKNAALLLSSLVFYAWGEPKYVLLMAGSIISGYVFGLLTEHFQGRPLSKIFMIASITVSLSFLLFFKYCNFFIGNFSAVTGIALPLLKITLPVGISFYTFQIISYTADVYMKKAKANRNIINFAAYVSLFPQLVAGPIVRYTEIEGQLRERQHSIDKAAEGIRLLVTGLSKKVLIADSLGELCSVYTESSESSVLFSWIYALSFSMQVYFDFSGYSDMAIGLGKIFGFDIGRNFNYPFISGSITEFWRRWHISLGSWFRDYVYIPLGGNRTTRLKYFRNILVVWMLTGLWHGASWNFVLWGLYFAVFLTAEKFLLMNFIKKHRLFAHLYTLFIVAVSFVIFSFSDLSEAGRCLTAMAGFGRIPWLTEEHGYYIRSFLPVLVIAAIGSTPLLSFAVRKIKQKEKCMKAVNTAEPIVLVLLLFLSTAYLVDGSFNPFMYFRF